MIGKAARNAELERLHSGGASYAALGRQFSLTPARVAQVIARVRRMRKTLALRLDAPLQHTT
ncbi:methylaspartate ammonia-lyase [Novosphingobium hassiacum]|uniref:Methylaspartate ammonia-lyase n=1 Tax=Novosphingobium hassiacum TaxID=173676 RepID=A0A7W6A0J8_9SPHN|nr:hypothetical protein [Novosphingobium hassiacum]MBB3862528.1 methylaspartate ammonia-lyase [Novosphingobium hassiacum]